MAGQTRREKSPHRWGVLMVIAILAGLVLLARLTRCRAEPDESFLSGVTHITIADDDPAAVKAHLAAAHDRIVGLDHLLSNWSKSSEVARVNEMAARRPVPVSDDLFAALAAGVEWHQRTGGAFDITISPLLALWRQCGSENCLPTEEELARVRALVGADRLVLDAGKRTVRVPVEGMRLDLGGLGKGLCADEVTKLLRERGVTGALVAVAGDIHALGTRANGKPWRIGIQDPRQPDNPEALLGTLELTDMAVSTSGNYQRFVEIQGKRYSHIVDPRTGMPANDVPSVTVIGPDALTTDIMGTALSVLGVQEGLLLVESMPGVEAIFITFDDEDRPHITRSSGFSAFEDSIAGH